MITKKKIYVQIYGCDVTVIKVDSLKEIQEKYNLKDVKSCAAISFKRKFNYYIAFEKAELPVIAHEVVHIVNHIFKDRGIELDLDNDEPQAYLTGWLFKKILKALSL